MALFNLHLPERKLKAWYEKKVLKFKNPAGTSRGIMLEKESFFIYVQFLHTPEYHGIGECSPIWGLSIDPKEGFESLIADICADINNYKAWMFDRLTEYPSIYFGLETALKDLEQKGKRILFPSNFTEKKEGILMNGLIWMGDVSFMLQQVENKLRKGYQTIKLKIGGLSFENELALLREIRAKYSPKELVIRLDANGAFTPEEALEKLNELSKFHIHSIEQPVRAGNWVVMKNLCINSPIPIALDEELIGIIGWEKKQELVQIIQPQYLILKPSLLGGFKSTEGWINIAQANNIQWWITSALESNIGLNAIAQFTYITGNSLPQGLGTGSLFENNTDHRNFVKGDHFYFVEL